MPFIPVSSGRSVSQDYDPSFRSGWQQLSSGWQEVSALLRRILHLQFGVGGVCSGR
jgi:hypothetical protein